MKIVIILLLCIFCVAGMESTKTMLSFFEKISLLDAYRSNRIQAASNGLQYPAYRGKKIFSRNNSHVHTYLEQVFSFCGKIQTDPYSWIESRPIFKKIQNAKFGSFNAKDLEEFSYFLLAHEFRSTKRYHMQLLDDLKKLNQFHFQRMNKELLELRGFKNSWPIEMIIHDAILAELSYKSKVSSWPS